MAVRQWHGASRLWRGITIISGGSALREGGFTGRGAAGLFPSHAINAPQPLVVHATASVTVTVVRKCSRDQ